MNKTLVLILLTSCLFACSDDKVKNNSSITESGYQWPVIKGFPKPQVPVDNPMSLAKVALGRHLFYDQNLSANQ
jgi:cytochrome c peroxidase